MPVELAPDTPEIVSVDFERGNPVAVNGKALSPATIISTLTEIAGRNGIGRDDMVENRFVGMKCRGVYENPAGTLLYKLHRDLEGICLDRELLGIRDMLAVRYAQCVYNLSLIHILPASSMCSIMPATYTSLPSDRASTSTSTACSRNLRCV